MPGYQANGDEILYGHVGERSLLTDEFVVAAGDGVTEYYDQYGSLCRVDLEAGAYYSFEAADIHFCAEGKGMIKVCDGVPHDENGPAYKDQATSQWYRHGLLHRLDGPAIICPSYQAWYKDDRQHRDPGPDGDVGPAFISDDEQIWYWNGLRHRLPDADGNIGPARIEDGNRYWYAQDRLHRQDGPAVEYSSGAVEYWWCGGYHREDGPALIDTDGSERYALDGNIFEDKKTWEHALRVRREISERGSPKT